MNREHRRMQARLSKQSQAKKPARARVSGLTAISNSLPFTQEEVARLSNEVRLAWYRLCNGEGSTHAFDNVVYTLNTLRVLADGLGPQAVGVVHAAQLAMLRVRERYQKTGVFGADGQGMADMSAALDLHDEFLNHHTPRQMFGALTKAVKRMERARNELRNGV